MTPAYYPKCYYYANTLTVTYTSVGFPASKALAEAPSIQCSMDWCMK